MTFVGWCWLLVIVPYETSVAFVPISYHTVNKDTATRFVTVNE